MKILIGIIVVGMVSLLIVGVVGLIVWAMRRAVQEATSKTSGAADGGVYFVPHSPIDSSEAGGPHANAGGGSDAACDSGSGGDGGAH